MDKNELKLEIKALIVRELNLEGRDPSTIDDDAPLFSTVSEGAADGGGQDAGGLGLDSLDALQLAMGIEERFGVKIPDGAEARPIFRSVATLAEHIAALRGSGG